MGVIRKKREPHMGLREFAKKLDISASYLSDLERGKRDINKKMLVRICCELVRITGEDLHDLYDILLMVTGHLTPERTCLKSVWGTCKSRQEEEIFHRMEHYAYKALYDEIDIAFYGRPLRKGKPEDRSHCVRCGVLPERLRDGLCPVCYVSLGGALV